MENSGLNTKAALSVCARHFNINKSRNIGPRTINPNLNNNGSFNEKQRGRRLAWFRIPVKGLSIGFFVCFCMLLSV